MRKKHNTLMLIVLSAAIFNNSETQRIGVSAPGFSIEKKMK